VSRRMVEATMRFSPGAGVRPAVRPPGGHRLVTEKASPAQRRHRHGSPRLHASSRGPPPTVCRATDAVRASARRRASRAADEDVHQPFGRYADARRERCRHAACHPVGRVNSGARLWVYGQRPHEPEDRMRTFPLDGARNQGFCRTHHRSRSWRTPRTAPSTSCRPGGVDHGALGAVAAVPSGVRANGAQEVDLAEVRPVGLAEVELRMRALPEQEAG
jgi:hypothetical protein